MERACAKTFANFKIIGTLESSGQKASSDSENDFAISFEHWAFPSIFPYNDATPEAFGKKSYCKESSR